MPSRRSGGEWDRPSTRDLVGILDLFDLADDDVLLATTEVERALYRSAGNLSNVNVQEVNSINTVDILDADALLLQKGAVEWLNTVLTTAPTVELAA